MLRATELAHDILRRHVRAGDAVVDATAGNGKDTLFLARLVGPAGWVHACDIQEEAIRNTSNYLAVEAPELANRIVLHRAGHENMATILPPELRGLLGAVHFNLGYLPGGDHSCITQPDTTITALTAAATLVRPGGLVSVVLYTGHAGAEAEVSAVDAWFGSLNEQWNIWRCQNLNTNLRAPYLLTATKR
jgi:predicted methyltransferase